MKSLVRNLTIAAAACGAACWMAPGARAQTAAQGAIVTSAPTQTIIRIDRFESDQNLLHGRTGQYQQEPSHIFATRTSEVNHGGGKSLKIRYDKKNAGGPSGTGGWCGYWTLLKNGKRLFDGSGCRELTFWVRGENGGENFRVGLADQHWDQLQDSVKSGDVTDYIPSGQITKEWQKVEIPLDTWFVDLKQLASISVCFESDSYPDGKEAGTVYIDDLEFE